MKSVVTKRLLLAALAASVIFVLPAYADEWSKTYKISGRPDLRIETTDANIRVTTWDQNTIEAKVITSRYKIGEGASASRSARTGMQSRSKFVTRTTVSTSDGAITAWTSLSRCRARAR
jgi:hypothetical protein